MRLQEHEGLVTLKGKPVVLLGTQVKSGDPAPDFRAVDPSFKPVALSGFRGKAVLISAVPSLDTPVCATQTRRFNQEAAGLGSGVQLITISMDLPFAQSRFCEAEKIKGILLLSDHVWREFGPAYGVLIKDMGLLARSIFVVDASGKVTYREIVREVAEEPDYDAALKALRAAPDS